MNDDTETLVLGPAQAEGLVGHVEAERALLQAATSGRLPHAWLFTGPPGIGKATLAFRFARFLLAGRAEEGAGLFGDGPASLAVDPGDPVFRRIASAAEPNLRLLQVPTDPKTGKRKSEIAVAQIRESTDFFRHTSADGNWRILIVDSVDAMSRSAANAILKILEEPPNRAVLILINHAAGRVLPTIRSRCRVLALAPLAAADCAAVLQGVAPDLSQDDAQRLALAAHGSPGAALALAPGGALALQAGLETVLADLPRLDVAKAQAFSDLAAKAGDTEAFPTAGRLMLDWIARTVRTEAATAGTAPERGSLDRWAALWDKTAALLRDAEARALDRKLVVLETLYDIQAAARGR
jgi:DNA polymerase-3 subunit delta'